MNQKLSLSYPIVVNSLNRSTCGNKRVNRPILQTLTAFLIMSAVRYHSCFVIQGSREEATPLLGIPYEGFPCGILGLQGSSVAHYPRGMLASRHGDIQP